MIVACLRALQRGHGPIVTPLALLVAFRVEALQPLLAGGLSHDLMPQFLGVSIDLLIQHFVVVFHNLLNLAS